MRKLEKFLKNLKKLKKYHTFTKYFLDQSNISNKQLNFNSKFITNTFNKNFEFILFFSGVGIGLFSIYKFKKQLNETPRLIAAGIATHIIVDFITYLGDKINTKVKVDYFYQKKNLIAKDINYYFEKKFSHHEVGGIKRKRKIAQTTLGLYLGDFHFRGIQAAMMFIVLNSIIFFGLYKNVKNYLKEKFNLHGFNNFFLAAAFSQFWAMLVAFPLENIKTRMQASNFNYDSLYKYYKKLIVGKSYNHIYLNLKNEYSGFVSHLVLFVVYESVTYAIYESLMKLGHNGDDNHEEKVDMQRVLIASSISGLISAVVTNPIDVYQINKQVNPKFTLNQLTLENIFLGMKERIYFITFLNISTFVFLESIGPKLFNIRIE
jgi:hypothetical protein